MPFVIQNTFEAPSKKKPGSTFTIISYFRENSGLFNHMETDWQKARNYHTSTEAHREKRKYFSRERGVKVINTNKLEGNNITQSEIS